MKSLRPTQHRRKRQRAATTVEIAICLPVLVMLLFAGYEAGRANMLHHATESAAYEGARVGIVPGANKEKIEEAANFVLQSVGARNAEIIVTPSVIEKDTAKVRVLIRVPMKSNSVLVPFFTKETVFEGQCEMTREVF